VCIFIAAIFISIARIHRERSGEGEEDSASVAACVHVATASHQVRARREAERGGGERERDKPNSRQSSTIPSSIITQALFRVEPTALVKGEKEGGEEGEGEKGAGSLRLASCHLMPSTYGLIPRACRLWEREKKKKGGKKNRYSGRSGNRDVEEPERWHFSCSPSTNAGEGDDKGERRKGRRGPSQLYTRRGLIIERVEEGGKREGGEELVAQTISITPH